MLTDILCILHNCNTLQNMPQHTATHCNTMLYILEDAAFFVSTLHIICSVTHCNTLQHTATHYNTLRHTATHCNTLQHTMSYILEDAVLHRVSATHKSHKCSLHTKYNKLLSFFSFSPAHLYPRRASCGMSLSPARDIPSSTNRICVFVCASVRACLEASACVW